MSPLKSFAKTSGHVDHGKSTLMGRLLHDLKIVSERALSKLRKEAMTIGKSSFALAWIMDQTTDERTRGVTVDIATTPFSTPSAEFTILDAPGHRDFIPNMIAGASQADFAVLVVDAGVNSFEAGLKGQTKEHALLVRSMGVRRVIVAVNKMDTVGWAQTRFDEIAQQMTGFLTQASFTSRNLTFVPCAALTGDNVTTAPDHTAIPASWYAGPTLLTALESCAAEPTHHALGLPLRMTVADVFRSGIMNPVSVTGRIDSGTLQVGDAVLALPSLEQGVIKGIELEHAADSDIDEAPRAYAVAGHIPTLHLTAIDPIHLRPGDVLTHPSHPVPLTLRFTAKLLALDHVLPMAADVFRGRMSAAAKVTELVALLEKSRGTVVKRKPRIVKPGEVARVVVELEKPLPLEEGMRIVIRVGGATVASGLVEGDQKGGRA